MGLADRDYSRGGTRGLGLRAGSVVTILIAADVAIWLVEVLFVHSLTADIIHYLAANPADIFERHWLWQVLTANFLHDPRNFGHILGNMLFLYFFGRELEEMYGRRDFLIFYLSAGSLAILAEAAINHFSREPAMEMLGVLPRVEIFGASGAVMGVVVLFTLFFPNRQIYLGFLIPIQAWLLCLLYVFFDLSGALGGGTGVAHWAHLTGAAYGFLYRSLDLRWERVLSRTKGLFRSLGLPGGRRPRPRLLREREPADRREPLRRDLSTRDPVSARIDEILEKISRSGRESLTGEEIDYLQKNYGRYRSEG